MSLVGPARSIVPVSQSERITAALRRNGVPVQLHIFPNEGHGLSNVTDVIALYRWMIAFMQQYTNR
jgi:dipeptidyl aminopeptidase/acylaminoacyl peptidase